MIRILLAALLASTGTPVVPEDVTPAKVTIARFVSGTQFSFRVYVRGTDGRT